VFEKAAQAQSKALGLADLRLIVYNQPKGEAEDVEGAAAARSVVDRLLEMVRDASG